MFHEDSFEVDFATGDLLALPVEAPVVSVNERMNLNYGLAKQLVARTGPELPAQLLAYVASRGGGPFLEGEVTSLPTGKLQPPGRRVIFVVWWTFDNEYTENLVFKCITNSIREADRHGLKSLAFPLFGRGHRLSFRTIAGGIAKSINQLQAIAKPFSVERVVFASTKDSEIEALRETMALPEFRIDVG